MPPEAEPTGSELERRLELAGARARRPRAAGGTLSARAAHDLRERLAAAGQVTDAMAAAPATAPDADAAAVDGSALRVERRRWTRATTPASALTMADLPPAAAGVLLPSVIATPVSGPQVRRRSRSSGRFRPWRLLAAAVIVALLAGAVAYGSNLFHGPSALTASVVEASGASATRVGTIIPLVAGTILELGDTVTVTPQGHATLALGDNLERLAGGSAMHLDRLDAMGGGVSQLTGRAYARVAAGQPQTFQVVTGPVTWSAAGTAFDIDREPVTSGPHAGQEKVTVLAIQDAVTAIGPGFDTPVPQGQRATIYIGAASPIVAPTLDAVPASALLDPWLQANGNLDAQAGLPLGILQGHLQTPPASAAPTPSPAVTPTPSSTAGETPGVTPTPSPHPTPTPAGPVKTPAPTPAPTPTPQPTVGGLGLSATSCPGGVVLAWGQFNGGGFVRYVTLRAPAGKAIPAIYPPRLGYISVVANTTARTALSAADTAGQMSSYTYRTLVVGSSNQVLAASGASTAGGAGQPAALDLNPPMAKDPLHTDFSWVTFSAPAACFTEYEVIDVTGAPKVIGQVFNASTFGVTVATTCSGKTFELRVVRNLALGTIITGQSAPVPCGS